MRTQLPYVGKEAGVKPRMNLEVNTHVLEIKIFFGSKLHTGVEHFAQKQKKKNAFLILVNMD